MDFKHTINSTRNFLLSANFAEGLRMLVGMLLPPLLMAQYDMLKYGIILSLGVLSVGIVDMQGPINHRRNAMMVTIALVFVVTLITGLINTNPILLGIFLAVVSFIFAMFVLYGDRAALIGVSVLLIMVLRMDKMGTWQQMLFNSFLLAAGGIWYSILSYSVYKIRPYRMAQQLLSESVYEVSEFLRIKADFYRKGTDYEQNMAKVLEKQISVHAKQNQVREILFKTREYIRDSTPEGRFLLTVFIDTVDLFEQIMSTYYNYQTLHEQFDKYEILPHFERVIDKMALILEDVALALKTGGVPKFDATLLEEVRSIKHEIALIEQQNEREKKQVLGIVGLKNIEKNIESILARIDNIVSYFNKSEKKNIKTSDLDVRLFVNSQHFDKKLLLENLTFQSDAFRHAIRTSIMMVVGFVVSKIMISYQLQAAAVGHWILLSIIVIAKPGFSTTNKRNFDRLMGTVLGGAISMFLLAYVMNKNLLFVILMLSMLMCYSIKRKHYLVGVLFLTVYVLLALDFAHLGGIELVKRRIIETLIGSVIAFVGSYVLFPSWGHGKLKTAMINALKANLSYYQEITILYFDQARDVNKYKLARKQVYVSTSNLSSLFQGMLAEPKSKQVFVIELHKFTAINYLLSSNMASLSLYYKDSEYDIKDKEELKPIIENTISLLTRAIDEMQKTNRLEAYKPMIIHKTESDMSRDTQEISIIEQFHRIQKFAYDVCKMTEKIDL